MKAWLRAWIGLLLGSGLMAAVQGLTAAAPGAPARFVVTAEMFSNAVAATAAAGLLLVAGLVLSGLRARLWHTGQAFWLGVAVGVLPLLLQWYGLPLAALCAVAVALLAPWLGRKVLDRGPLWPGIVGWWAVFLLGVLWAEPERTLDSYLQLPADGPTQRAQGPDIVLVSIDTLRADAVLNNPLTNGKLPTFERLRREGLWADHARSSSNQTLPGHVGMLSGLDAMAHGIRENKEVVPDEIEFVSETLQAAGWRTGAILSNGVLIAESGMSQGYDVYDDSTSRRSPIVSMAPYLRRASWLGLGLSGGAIVDILRPTVFKLTNRKPPAMAEMKAVGGRGRGRVTTDHALKVMDQMYAQDHPYFLFLHYLDPHHPYGAPEGFDGVISAGHEPERRFLPKKAGDQIKDLEIETVVAGLNAHDPAAQAASAYFQKLYLENVMFVDSLLAEVVARVEASGRPTIVLVTSDHGEHFAENNLMLHANSLYEPLLRVPFVVWGANVPAKRLANPVQLCDAVPTLLHLAGIEFEIDNYSGVALTMINPERNHIAADEAEVAVAGGGWKWIARWAAAGGTEAHALYFIKRDPVEFQNRHGRDSLPDELAAWRDKALERDMHAERQLQAPSSGFENPALAELGYADGVMAGGD